MTHYRSYLFNEDGHIVQVETADFLNDPDALAWAEVLCLRQQENGKIEVWDRARLVGTRTGSSPYDRLTRLANQRSYARSFRGMRH